MTDADHRDCATVAGASIPADADTVTLVADNTASDAGGGLPPAIEESLREAQRTGQILVIVPVDGDGANPVVRQRIALDPSTGEDSPRADRARDIVISCVERWLRAPESQPNSPGSDILAAIGAAAREQPTTILVISDGLGTAGGLDVNRHGFDVDPAQLARDAQDAAEPQLRETSILWAGLGNSTTQLPQALRNSLRTLWTALLTEAGAEVAFDDRSGPPAAAVDGLPEDSPARRPPGSTGTIETPPLVPSAR
ncbi:hypothetical protein [Micromonospora sp. LOL_021]|uniref:hypothetical protein n=1 Tax=Micromonospora sp. LOL_021 TaxID=3345417 RepID=UPI003A86B55B